MLDAAIKHKEDLQNQFRNIWFQDKYKFWNYTNYYGERNIEESTWNVHQFVSLDSQENVIGYIGYSIDRTSDCVHGLNIINFTENKIIFGLDAGKALKDIFEKFGFRKLIFSVVVGNPIEHTYDQMIKKYGGRIVGTYEKQARLTDGKLYDEKMYEVIAENYFERNRGAMKKLPE